MVQKQITQLSGKDAKDAHTTQIEQRLETSEKAHERVLEMIHTLQVRVHSIPTAIAHI